MDDRVWGVVLMAIGLAMIGLHPWSQRLDGWLKGLPNDVMTAILVLLAIIIICIAFSARPAIKALLILWIVMPWHPLRCRCSGGMLIKAAGSQAESYL